MPIFGNENGSEEEYDDMDDQNYEVGEPHAKAGARQPARPAAGDAFHAGDGHRVERKKGDCARGAVPDQLRRVIPGRSLSLRLSVGLILKMLSGLTGVAWSEEEHRLFLTGLAKLGKARMPVNPPGVARAVVAASFYASRLRRSHGRCVHREAPARLTEVPFLSGIAFPPGRLAGHQQALRAHTYSNAGALKTTRALGLRLDGLRAHAFRVAFSRSGREGRASRACMPTNFFLVLPRQVASHAQKYFIRQSNMNKRKRRCGFLAARRESPRAGGHHCHVLSCQGGND